MVLLLIINIKNIDIYGFQFTINNMTYFDNFS